MMDYDRFIAKVKKNAKTGCWLWTGACDPSGYGRAWAVTGTSPSKKTYAHRWSFELHHRKLRTGEVVHHKCAVRGCVNPDHLEAISQSSNVAEATLRRQLEARIVKLEQAVEELRLQR